MKRFALAAILAIGVTTSAALAADMAVPSALKAPAATPVATSPWDVAFGGALMTDYEFRGITQSDHKPSVAAYSELRYNFNPNLQVYYGNAGESIDFPNPAAAEIDLYGGIRPTFDKLAFDFGFSTGGNKLQRPGSPGEQFVEHIMREWTRRHWAGLVRPWGASLRGCQGQHEHLGGVREGYLHLQRRPRRHR